MAHALFGPEPRLRDFAACLFCACGATSWDGSAWSRSCAQVPLRERHAQRSTYLLAGAGGVHRILSASLSWPPQSPSRGGRALCCTVGAPRSETEAFALVVCSAACSCLGVSCWLHAVASEFFLLGISWTCSGCERGSVPRFLARAEFLLVTLLLSGCSFGK